MEMARFCALSKNSVKRCAGVQGGARSRRRGSRQGCGAGREVLGEARQSRERLRPRAAVSLPAWLAAREGSKHHEPKKRLVADRNGGTGKSSRHSHRTPRSEEHTSELQTLLRISYAVFCLKKKSEQSTNISIT